MSAGSRAELLARGKGPHGMSLPPSAIVPSRIASPGSILRSMIQPLGYSYDVMCSWLQNINLSSAVGVTVASSHDRSMNG
jgi:hypothetical protein